MGIFENGSFQAVEAEYGIALTQRALAAQRAKSIARIEVFVVLGNHDAFRFQQAGLREKSKSLLVVSHLAVRRIEKTEVADNGLRIQHAQSEGGLTFNDLSAFIDAEGMQVVPDGPCRAPRRLNEIRMGRAAAQCFNADSSRARE